MRFSPLARVKPPRLIHAWIDAAEATAKHVAASAENVQGVRRDVRKSVDERALAKDDVVGVAIPEAEQQGLVHEQFTHAGFRGIQECDLVFNLEVILQRPLLRQDSPKRLATHLERVTSDWLVESEGGWLRREHISHRR